jgi:predicted DNA binding CopG/RHH family protein
MRAHYDFSKASRNPYANRLKKQVTIRLTNDAIAYFKEMAGETGVPYQTLIDMYLRDCAAKRRRLSMRWKASA